MKLVAQRNFYFEDTVRGRMVAVKKGEEFSLDVKKDAEQIFGLISSLSAYPIDPEYIPEKQKYLCLVHFSYQLNGETKHVKHQEIVTLSREDGAKYMVLGFVRPINLEAWNPKNLLGLNIAPNGTVKKMFDSPEEKPDNWATKGVARK